MKKLKLMTILGTRPEIIKMSEIIKKCDVYFDHILVHTGQNYDYTLNEVFFQELGLRAPDYYLGVVGENLGQTMGNVIAKSYELMSEVKPDAVIVLETGASAAFANIGGRKTAICDVLLRAPQQLSAQAWENAMLENISALVQALK